MIGCRLAGQSDRRLTSARITILRRQVHNHAMEHIIAVTLALAIFFGYAVATSNCTGDLVMTSFTPVVIKDGEDQCSGSKDGEILNEINQNVSIFLQGVNLKLLVGTTAKYAGNSCAEIADHKPNCPSGNYYVLNSTGSAVQVYCEMGDVFPDSLNVTDGWVRVANLNMADPDQQCPDNFLLYADPVRACGKSTGVGGCDSITFSTYGIQYQQVCGRVRGYQFHSPDAFGNFGSCGYPCNDIDAPYVDGVSITHGNPRQHIWTYAVGLVAQPTETILSSCPCTSTGRAPPDFVGTDYYCESGLFQEPWSSTVYSDDPLWDGQDCDGDEGTCCDPPNLPWFCKELPQETTDDLEVRLCMDQDPSDENILTELFELYMQ